MVLWGGLRPILSRVILDVLTLLGLSYSTLTTTGTKANVSVLLLSCFLTISTAGFTSRWTLTLPMAPLLILQGLRRMPAVKLKPGTWLARGIGGLSVMCILMGAALSVLFPAVELPPIQGPYNVGVVDFFMPVEMSKTNGTCDSYSHVSVRMLYPTLEEPEPFPYLDPEIADEYCRQSMKFGAPAPLKKFGWMLHTWRLTGLRAKRNAQLVPGNEKHPLVVFSHGLGGIANIYAYQTMALAAHGSVVLVVNHLDGSAPVVQRLNGTVATFDHELPKLWHDGKYVEYVRARRGCTNHRVEEFLAATEAVHHLNDHDLMELHRLGVSFRGRLQTNHTFFMGHSFGAATALTAAKRRPDLVRSVIAHEPANDWIPDDTRRSLFAEERLQGLNHTYSGGTGGFENDSRNHSKIDSSIHDIDMLLLFSHEWMEKQWSGCHVLEAMHRHGRLGPKGGPSALAVIGQAHHTEFSDTCMLTPLWLARATGITGQRNPLESAKEIHERTQAFVDTVRRNPV